MNKQERHASTSSMDRHICAIRQEIDSRLNELLASVDNLQSVMREMTSGGKRLRPIFVVIVGRVLGCRSKALIDAGCAIEMVHAASLAVDDLPCMDNSFSRRGRPAVHVQFGEPTAILAAVALLGRAFQTVTSPERFSLETRGALAAVLARTIGPEGLPGGQFDDLNPSKATSIIDSRQINMRKTGTLFVAGVDAAACVAKVGGSKVRQLRSYAHTLGSAYQTLDDIRDSCRFSSRAVVSVLAEVEEAGLLLRQHMEGGARAEMNAAGLMDAFYRSVFASDSPDDSRAEGGRAKLE